MSVPEPYFVKLVRDDVARHVPDATISFGPTPDGKLLDLLKAKLVEEVGEFLVDPSLGELADIYEVLRALALRIGYSIEQVELSARDKRDERGGFERGTGMFCTTTEEAERLNSHALKAPSSPAPDSSTEGSQR